MEFHETARVNEPENIKFYGMTWNVFKPKISVVWLNITFKSVFYKQSCVASMVVNNHLWKFVTIWLTVAPVEVHQNHVLVPVQKLCVNIYVYIWVYFPYTTYVIGRIYNGIVIQYWRSSTPSRSIGVCAVPGLNAILCFLWFTNCVLLFDKNLLLGCLWHLVFV